MMGVSSFTKGILSARLLTGGSDRFVTASCLGEVGVVTLKRVPFEEAQGEDWKAEIAGGGR